MSKTTKPETKETLSADEKALLKKLETAITKHLKSFVSTGEALFTIQQKKLYRDTGMTFEEYTVARFDFSTRQGAYKYINAYKVVTKLKEMGFNKLPDRESQCRSLVSYVEGENADKLKAIWEKVLEDNKKVTAAAIDKAIRAINKPKSGTSGDSNTNGTDGPESTGNQADSEPEPKKKGTDAQAELIKALQKQLKETKAALGVAEREAVKAKMELNKEKEKKQSKFKGSKLYKDLIKEGYRALSKKHHPDAGGDEETMKALNELYSEMR